MPEAGEFDLDGLDHDVVLEFLLHGYIGPCFDHIGDAGDVAYLSDVSTLGTDLRI